MTHYTFTEKQGFFTWTVKAEFLKIVSKPEELDFVELITKHQIGNYLENPKGLAVIYTEKFREKAPNAYKQMLENNLITKDGGNYFINGQVALEPEAREKLEKDIKFNNKFDSILNDEE